MFLKKLSLFMAATGMALFLGAISVQAQTPPVDTDGDGIPDNVDECPNSNLAPTVLVESCDTGIVNTVNSMGCTLADLIDEIIDECADGAKNHGKFVSCVAHETNMLKRAKTISGKQKGKIQSCAAHAPLP